MVHFALGRRHGFAAYRADAIAAAIQQKALQFREPASLRAAASQMRRTRGIAHSNTLLRCRSRWRIGTGGCTGTSDVRRVGLCRHPVRYAHQCRLACRRRRPRDFGRRLFLGVLSALQQFLPTCKLNSPLETAGCESNPNAAIAGRQTENGNLVVYIYRQYIRYGTYWQPFWLTQRNKVNRCG